MKKKILYLILQICFTIISTVILFLFILYFYYSKNIVDISNIENQIKGEKVEILYSNNTDHIKTYNSSKIEIIPYGEIPKDLIDALIATEDRKFFNHSGIDYFSIIRALIVDLKHKHLKQGGSTISQQLAKLILRDNSKTFKRKFKELILAKKMEKQLSKEAILSLYLSISYFGSGQYGIKDASKFYFNKELEELTLEECAMLVGLLKAPSKYNPSNSGELAENRTRQVILNMQDAGFIDKNDILTYIIPDLNFSYNITRKNNSQNYFFSDWVYNQVKEMNLDKTNKITVSTTLDYGIQNIVIETVNNFVDKNKQKIGKSELAIIVMNKKGEVLAMVGGKDYNISQFNRVIYAQRQTGSLFKLFIYLTGFERGLKINDTFMDEPIKVANWYPENNNKRYYGKITVKEAFMLSSNSVAVQIADYFGIDEVVKTAKKLGIINDFKNDLTIALGSQESTLFDMTTAYATVVNGGIPVFPYAIKHIVSNGNIVYRRNTSEKRPVFKEDAIEKMQYLLFSVVENGTGKRAKIESLVEKTRAYNMMHRDNKFFIGGKTGSTQNSRDAWFVGFANDFIVGVWFGNDDNNKTNGIMGGNLPAELWREVVEKII